MPGRILNRSPPAPTVIGPATKSATRPTTPLPRYLIDEARLTQKVPFNAAQHLNFQPPTQILSMKDIGLEGHGISPNAVSEPFRLFTDEAIKQIRAEVFDEETLKDCQFASDFNKNMVRGMGPRYVRSLASVGAPTCRCDVLIEGRAGGHRLLMRHGTRPSSSHTCLR